MLEMENWITEPGGKLKVWNPLTIVKFELFDVIVAVAVDSIFWIILNEFYARVISNIEISAGNTTKIFPFWIKVWLFTNEKVYVVFQFVTNVEGVIEIFVKLPKEAMSKLFTDVESTMYLSPSFAETTYVSALKVPVWELDDGIWMPFTLKLMVPLVLGV